MDFGLTDEERSIRETARSFVAGEVMPLEPEVLRRERNGEPGLTLDELVDLQRRAKRFGFWGLGMPEDLGGADLPAVTQSLIMTEVGRTFVPFMFGGDADNILVHEADEYQKETYLRPTIAGDRIACFALTEPGAGSDLSGLRMRAKRNGGDWILNGEKTFISRAEHADYAIVVAVTDTAKGIKGGSTAFLVDRDLGWTSSPIQTMGPHLPASVHFDDVRVPDCNVLGEVGQGFSLAMAWIGRGRYLIPSVAVGAGERLLSMAVEYARQRVAFGNPIGDYQAIQWMIADSELDLEHVRHLALRTAWLVDQGLDARHDASLAKLSGAAMANRVADRVLQIHGGLGYTRELPIERWYREVRVWRIFEGTDEIQRRTIARDLLTGRRLVGGHFG